MNEEQYKYLLMGSVIGAAIIFVTKTINKKSSYEAPPDNAITKYGKPYYDEKEGAWVQPTEGGGI